VAVSVDSRSATPFVVIVDLAGNSKFEDRCQVRTRLIVSRI
jgi:hypothetical protein